MGINAGSLDSWQYRLHVHAQRPIGKKNHDFQELIIFKITKIRATKTTVAFGNDF